MSGSIKIGGSFPGSGGGGGGGSGTVTKVTTQGGPFLAAGAFTTAGTISNSVTSLTANAILLGTGTAAPTPLGSLGTTTTLLHGNAAGAPTFGPVSLSADVTGQLPFANMGTLAASSLAGNSTGAGATITSVPISVGLTFISGSLAVGGSGGTVDLSGQTEIKVPTPINAADAATKAYVDNVAAGINPAVAVQAATTVAGNTSGFTYNNGAGGIGATLTGSVNTAFTVDGFTFTAVGQRVLIKNDTQSPSGAFNGVYFVTQLQTAILPPILTRALDYDTPGDINNTGTIPVVNGTVNGTTSWLLTSSVTTVGTDPLTYVLFSRNPANQVTSVIAQGGPFLANGTITSTGTISNSTSSLTPHGVLLGEGTSAAVATAAGTDGQLLIATTSADPAFTSVSGDATITKAGVITVTKIGGVTPVTVANTGLVINAGTVQLNNVVTLTGTAAGTLSVNPGSGTTEVVINLAASGGTQTLSYSGAFAYQPFTMHLKQGATASVVVLNSGTVAGFVFGATQGPTSFTATPSANVTDSLFCKGITTSYARVYALDQGFVN